MRTVSHSAPRSESLSENGVCGIWGNQRQSNLVYAVFRNFKRSVVRQVQQLHEVQTTAFYIVLRGNQLHPFVGKLRFHIQQGAVCLIAGIYHGFGAFRLRLHTFETVVCNLLYFNCKKQLKIGLRNLNRNIVFKIFYLLLRYLQLYSVAFNASEVGKSAEERHGCAQAGTGALGQGCHNLQILYVDRFSPVHAVVQRAVYARQQAQF